MLPSAPGLVSLDRTAPVGNLTNATALTYRATFSEPVIGVDAADFQVVKSSGVSVSHPLAVSGGGSVYTITISGVGGNGSVALRLVDNHTIHDSAGNLLAKQISTADFTSKPTLSAGPQADAVAIGDVNGDGHPDLAINNEYTTSTVSIFLGNGNGTFRAARNFDVGYFPSAVALADLNGDGRLDLVVANEGSHSVSLLLGNGNGTFSAARNLASGAFPLSVALADMNGDGRTDLTVVNNRSNSVSLFLGNGNGTFQAARNRTTGYSPQSVAVADVNGDGRRDLEIANTGNGVAPGNTVSILLGNGNGTFQAAHNFTTGVFPRSLHVADLNGDGRADLAVANRNSDSVSVLLGNGNGTFAVARNLAAGSQPGTVAMADLNGDGHVDLTVSNYLSSTVSVLLGNGNGTFLPAQNFATTLTPASVAIADLNGDGYADLLDVCSDFEGIGKVDIRLGTSRGDFSAPTVTVDHAAPTLKSMNRASPTSQTTNATSVTYLVTFSEQVTGVNTNVAADFTLLGAGATGASIGTPTTSNGGLTWSIPVTHLNSANGTLQLHLAHTTGIKDLAGNGLAGSTATGQPYTLDHKSPAAVWTAVATPTKTAIGSVTLKFSEAVQNVSLASISWNGTKLSTLKGVSLAVNTSTNAYTISGLSGYDSAAKTYVIAIVSGNTIKDLAGNALAGLPSLSWTVKTSSPAAAFPPSSSVIPPAAQLDETLRHWVAVERSETALRYPTVDDDGRSF